MRRWLLGTLGIAGAVGVCVGTLFAVSSGENQPVPLLVNCAIATLYSLCIGVPAMIVFPRLKPKLFGKPQLRQWLAYIGTLLAITLFGTLLTRFILFATGVVNWSEAWAGYVETIEVSIAIAIPATIGAVAFSRMSHRLAATELERQRALVHAAEARLASLESRIRPHFLFNALNSAIALIPEDPRRAEDLLERLSALLRFSLDAQARLVALGEELRIVVDYLEIERVRFGARLAYDIDVPGALHLLEIPAFAVQTLVENSVKYAVSPRAQGARIVVRARLESGRLVLDVTDDGPGFTGDVWVPGHGLDGLRARLDALYGADARLVAPAAASTGAAVTIDLPAAGAS
jgi:two-component system, LytTR family, sensor histidine kinase AlgZ